MTRLLRHLRRSERGAAAVEFAIISVVLVTALIGIIDFGRTLYVKNQLSWLADRAARAVLIDPDIGNATIEADLRDEFSAGVAEDLSVSLGATSVDGRDYRTLTVTYPITLFIPNLVTSDITLSVTRRIPAR